MSFGTSGHRGSAFHRAFNDAHVAAISQAIAEHRAERGITGPLFLGIDSHALSTPALATTLQVLAANHVQVHVPPDGQLTPTPAISHAILTHNAGNQGGTADGIVLTPSHNPPEDGGYKYNPPHGGPAGGDVTAGIEARANELLGEAASAIRRVTADEARGAATTADLVGAYVGDLPAVVDLDAIRGAGVRIGVDPLGGAAVEYWQRIAEVHDLDLEVVNDRIDPTFSFMTLDSDGRIRMDCSSVDAMQGLIGLAERFDVAFGNDTDADRHGIVTPGGGLMNPNHYLAVAISHLVEHRTQWSSDLGIGKTLVSSSLLDRVVAGLDRRLVEVPVGFKWFVDGLADATLAFGGEESAGASFLRRDGGTWTTDKDGIVLALLAAEVVAVTGRGPDELHAELTEQYGAPVYRRVDAPATAAQKEALASLAPEDVDADELAGDPITAMLTRAPGNDEPIGGLKITTEQGWFAARPSGTEDKYKIYAESFRGEDHLEQLLAEARSIVDGAFAGGGG